MRKLVLMIVLTFLGGCGVKGPLYLPDQMYPQPKEQMPAPPRTPNAEPQAVSPESDNPQVPQQETP